MQFANCSKQPPFLKHMLEPAVSRNKTSEKIHSWFKTGRYGSESPIPSQFGGGSNQACAETAEEDEALASRFNLSLLGKRGANHEC